MYSAVGISCPQAGEDVKLRELRFARSLREQRSQLVGTKTRLNIWWAAESHLQDEMLLLAAAGANRGFR
jgi:hypothetical protein